MAIKLRALLTYFDRGGYTVAGDVFEVNNEYQAEAYVSKGLAEYVSEKRQEEYNEDQAEEAAAEAIAEGEIPLVLDESKKRKKAKEE